MGTSIIDWRPLRPELDRMMAENRLTTPEMSAALGVGTMTLRRYMNCAGLKKARRPRSDKGVKMAKPRSAEWRANLSAALCASQANRARMDGLKGTKRTPATIAKIKAGKRAGYARRRREKALREQAEMEMQFNTPGMPYRGLLAREGAHVIGRPRAQAVM